MSWEATCWVMERSAHKGGDLLCMLLIANDMNAEGQGNFSTRSRLARQMRVDTVTVSRILRRLERSGELVCDARGTGHVPSAWRMPGVAADGFSAGMRGGKLPPQGRRIAIPGVAKRHPRGGETPPIPLLPSFTTAAAAKVPPPPPPTDQPAAPAAPTNSQEKAPQELIDWLAMSVIHLDRNGADRLWAACRARVPTCTVLEVEWACQHKLERSKGARNLAGLIISTVPDLLVQELEVAGVAQGEKNSA